MSTFLISNKNLKDLTDAEDARHNLGLGSMATQDSDDVTITGGHIYADVITIKAPDIEGKYVIADKDGTLTFENIDVPDWIQNNPALSEFLNDKEYVASNELADVCFTGQYADLTDAPDFTTNWNDFAETFVDKTYFLVDSNNLSELHENAYEVGQNLGLKSMAYQSHTNVTVSNLTIKENFRFYGGTSTHEDNTELYLGIDDNQYAVWKTLPIATLETPGILALSDEYKNEPDESVYTAASTKAVYEAFAELNDKILDLGNQSGNVNRLIDKFGLISVANDLEGVSDAVKTDLRNLLELGTISRQDATDVVVTNIEIAGQLTYRPQEEVDGFLLCESGHVSIVSKDELVASYNEPGLVRYTSERIEEDETVVVPSAHLVNTQIEMLDDKIEQAKIDITNNIFQTVVLANLGSYLNRTLDNVNTTTAFDNLGLPRVARTGRYEDLDGAGIHLSDLDGHLDLLQSGNNLSELSTFDRAYVSRVNLGLGSMSVQNSDSVNIVNGIANFTNVTVTDTFSFQHHVEMQNGQFMFLRCMNMAGHAEWGEIPIATENQSGVIKATDNLDNIDEATVITGFGFAKKFQDLEGRIDAILASLDQSDTNLSSDIRAEVVAAQLNLVNALTNANIAN